jgi:hypothetical protein
MQNNYTFPVSSGLLTAGHVAKMGENIWCFLWCVNRTTEDVPASGENLGKVLGGHAVPAARIAGELGLSEEVVSRQLEQLASVGYLHLSRLRDGFCIEVRRSIKWRKYKPASRGGDPVPMKSLVDGLRERLAAREAEANLIGNNQKDGSE